MDDGGNGTFGKTNRAVGCSDDGVSRWTPGLADGRGLYKYVARRSFWLLVLGIVCVIGTAITWFGLKELTCSTSLLTHILTPLQRKILHPIELSDSPLEISLASTSQIPLIFSWPEVFKITVYKSTERLSEVQRDLSSSHLIVRLLECVSSKGKSTSNPLEHAKSSKPNALVGTQLQHDYAIRLITD